MREITYAEALREAQLEEMRRDDNVIILGEDIRADMTFRATGGLLAEFGPNRVIDTPMCEPGFMGAGIGAAMMGLRPIIEIQVANFITLAMDQVINQAAKLRYMSGGQLEIPIVIRTANGYWGSFAGHHSDNVEAWFLGIPGLKIAVPSTPQDAKGLLKTSIRDDSPVLFLEHKRLYSIKGPVPEGDGATLSFGEADIKRVGDDVTIVATSYMVHKALEAAETLSRDGIEVEVIDPRTLFPLDKKTILESVRKTGRLVAVAEGPEFGGVTTEIISAVVEDAFYFLDSPPRRVGALYSPVPFSPPLEEHVIPGAENIVGVIREIFPL